MRPARSILDPKFVYVNAASTDIRKTFSKARRQINQEIADEQTQKVRTLKTSKATT